MDSSDEGSFVTAPSQPGMAGEFLVEVSKVQGKLEKIGDQAFTPAQTAKIRAVMSKVEEKLKETDTPVEPDAAIAEAKSSVKKALREKAAPRTKKALLPRAEIQHSQVAEHCVAEKEIEEVTNALQNVPFVPDTRLVIAYPLGSEQSPSKDPLVSIRRQLNGKALYGVIQSSEHADYTFPLPGYKQSEIQIIYDPKSNYCHLGWNIVGAGVGAGEDGPDTISIASLEIMRMRQQHSYSIENTSWNTLELSKFVRIRPGCWRILVSSSEKEYPSTIDILLLRRPFQFEVTVTNTNRVMQRKREYIDDIKSRRSKRLKGEAASIPDTAIPNIVIPGTADNDVIWAFQTFPDFRIEQKAVIKSQVEGKEHQYFLQTNKECAMLGKNWTTRVFSCQYSRMPKRLIAVKLFFHANPSAAKLWKQEVTILKLLNHENIVKLVGYDARIYVIYQELESPTLNLENHEIFQSPVKLSCILKILQNMASALAYLFTKSIVHNDVKPANISYSLHRGAVLLDFGIACHPSTPTRMIGGSPWYIPPEYLISKSRGFAGDMWALGITMLYLLGAIPLPDQHSPGWIIANLFEIGSDRKLMELWLEIIENKRQELCEPDGLNKIKELVAQMLHNEADERVTAAELETLANEFK